MSISPQSTQQSLSSSVGRSLESVSMGPVMPLTPLLPVAMAVTAGIMLSRYLDLSPYILLIGLGAAIASWFINLIRNRDHLALLCLWTVALIIGALWYQVRMHPYPNDILHYAHHAGDLIRCQGRVVQSPDVIHPVDSPLRTRPGQPYTNIIIELESVWYEKSWQPMKGNVRLQVQEEYDTLRPGDLVEFVGTIQSLPGPRNPGEVNLWASFRSQDLSARIRVKSKDAIRVVEKGSLWKLSSLIGRLRRWGSNALADHLPEKQAHIAQALLLGQRKAIEPGQREAYVRTGVCHILAISGQHLAIICGLLWYFSRLVGVSRRKTAGFIIFFVLLYTLVTGSRPPTVRAAILVVTFCFGIIIRRQSQPINTLALAWLIIIIRNPSEIFQTGCQLSFLAVLALYQVMYRWRQYLSVYEVDTDTIDNVGAPRWYHYLIHPWQSLRIQQSSDSKPLPHWLRMILINYRKFLILILSGMVVWLTLAPLIAARWHIVTPIAMLLNPVILILVTVILFAGLLFLLLIPISSLLAAPFLWMLETGLLSCEKLVLWGESVPAGHWYVASIPNWWVIGFYLGLLIFLLYQPLRRHWKSTIFGGLLWISIGLFATQEREIPNELHCTFLSVGDGSCVVLETPDGRVLLYDAGAMIGPQVTAKHIAPFLWSRGITTLDEVFISHADLDHFNGLPALMDRFRIGRVSLTPTFAEKNTPGVQMVYQLLRERKVRVRIVAAGYRLQSREVSIEVLHPPRKGPEGSENARSMVLYIQYLNHGILLTGDLAETGLEMVSRTPAPRIDVMLAPHHGSVQSNTDDFADWAKAGLIISSQDRSRFKKPDPYTELGGTYWRTWQEGGVAVRFNRQGIFAETFMSGRRWKKIQ